MIDFHSSVPLNQDLLQRPKSTKNSHPTLLFSARPNLQQLPFLNKLKVIRELLINLKNQKLRKSLYVVTEGCEKNEHEGPDIFRHEKAKLSVMDLISEEGKFEELSNTIQTNLIRQSISPIPNIQNEEVKKQPGEFTIANDILESEKQKKNNKPKKSTVLTRKNRIASDLNKLGHELEQTYLQVEELQQIFQTLCQFYSEKRSIVDWNLKLKQQRDLIQQKIQEFQTKIFDNQRQEILLNDKMDDFIEWYKLNITSYVKEVLNYNTELDSINRQLQIVHSGNIAQKQKNNIGQPPQKRDDRSCSSDSESKQIQKKSLEINLKFRSLKTELEKIKADKKTAAQNKNKQKKAKNQSNQGHSFNKLYVSQMYTL